jgi:hypothetical protein
LPVSTEITDFEKQNSGMSSAEHGEELMAPVKSIKLLFLL